MKRLFSIGRESTRFQSESRVLQTLLREMQALGLVRFADLDRRDETKKDVA